MPDAKDDKKKKSSKRTPASKPAPKKPVSKPRTSTKVIKETAAKPIAQKPIGKNYLTKGQGLVGYLLTLIISVLAAVIITVLLIPLIMGINPISFYGGDMLSQSANSKTVIKTRAGENTVTAVAKKVTPSIVTISVSKQQDNSFLFPLEPTSPSEAEVSGSGVIYRSDGYIITNNHVVEDASKVVVTIGEATDVPAKVVSTDSENDIAVVKVDKKDLPAIEIGSSKDLKVGDLAIAIGTPFKFQHTVTSGIISAKNRVLDIPDIENSHAQKILTDLIQTDAAINPGNSGGGLVDEQGRLIGINTAIASNTASSAGIGFAIPVERAIDTAKQLVAKGKAAHPYVGVNIVDSKKVADKNLPVGVFVQNVLTGSPAYKSGIKSGDIITKIGNKNVKTADEFISIIKRGKVGQKIKLTIIRDKKTIDAIVALADKPSKVQP